MSSDLVNERLMAEGYTEMADESLAMAQEALQAQTEALSEWEWEEDREA